MEIIVVTDARRNRRRVHLGSIVSRVAVLSLVATVAGAFGLGWHLSNQQDKDPGPELRAAALKHELGRQRAQVDRVVRDAQANVDALASKLGELQARVVRLDALGGRLVSMADLDADEFAFGEQPGLGGLPQEGASSFTVPDFVDELRELSQHLADREPKLEAVETAMMSSRLLDQIHPSGRPVVKGFLSSKFGWRADPITGRKNFHEGVDYAGRKNSPIISVASGVVRYAGRRSGYGKVVEISHGNGYMTRYAHNSRNLVKVGQKVEKGQKIALMGATGYATGVHVHFEVMQNGKPVNPLTFTNKHQ